MEKKTVTLSVNKHDYENLREYVYEEEGKIRGALGDHASRSFREYVDKDRFSRIEDKLDQALSQLNGRERDENENPPEPSNQSMETAEKIAVKAKKENQTNIHRHDLEKIIEVEAGSSDKTKRKYINLIKNHGLLFEHPVKDNTYFIDPAAYVQKVEKAHQDGIIMDQMYGKLVNEFFNNGYDWDKYKDNSKDRGFQ